MNPSDPKSRLSGASGISNTSEASDASDKPSPSSDSASNLLSRIKQASSEFDFGALLSGSGSRGSSHLLDEQDELDAADDEDIRAAKDIVDLYRNPPPPLPDLPEIVNVPSWERGKPGPQVHARQPASAPGPIPPLSAASTAERDPALGRSASRRRRSRVRRRSGRPSYLRAAAMRLVICGWTLLVGASIGIGVGAQVERMTSFRILASTPEGHSSPTGSAVKGIQGSSRDPRSHSPSQAKPRTPAKNSNVAASHKNSAQDAASSANLYWSVLMWPALAAGLCSLLWIGGAPGILRYHEGLGYILLAILVVASSTLAGGFGIMATMEHRMEHRAAGNPATAQKKNSSSPTSHIGRQVRHKRQA